MGWPVSAHSLRALVALLVLGTLGGCSAYLAEEGDPAAPVLARGRIVDASGGGMSGAEVRVQIGDHAGARPGEPVPVVYEGRFRAGLDGAFVIRLAPTPELTTLAREGGGFVTVSLSVFADEVRPFAFPRELRDGTWAGQIPTFVFGPDGVTEVGSEPGAPMPAPAET